MLSENILNTLQKNGIQTDMFGREIKTGDMVLCKGYCSQSLDTFAKVVKVNKKSIVIDLEKIRIHYGPFKPKLKKSKQPTIEDYYPEYKETKVVERTRRKGCETLLVTEDFKNQVEEECKKSINKYPELFI